MVETIRELVEKRKEDPTANNIYKEEPEKAFEFLKTFSQVKESRKSFLKGLPLTKPGLDKYAEKVLKCRDLAEDYILPEHELETDTIQKIDEIRERLNRDEVENPEYYHSLIKELDFDGETAYFRSKLLKLRGES